MEAREIVLLVVGIVSAIVLLGFCYIAYRTVFGPYQEGPRGMKKDSRPFVADGSRGDNRPQGKNSQVLEEWGPVLLVVGLVVGIFVTVFGATYSLTGAFSGIFPEGAGQFFPNC